MAITLATGESLNGDGNELAHIDLLIGSKSGPVGEAFANAFVNETSRPHQPAGRRHAEPGGQAGHRASATR